MTLEQNLTGKIQTDTELEEWLSDNATNLKRLRIRNAHLTDRGAKRIMEYCSGLEELDLGDNLISDEGAEALSMMPNLQSLNLYGNQVTDYGASLLVTGLDLSELNLCGNKLTTSGLRMIANHAEKFEKLHLGFLQMGDSGAEALQSAKWPLLKELNVRLNQLSSKSLPGFLDKERFPALEYLGIEENPLGDDVVGVLLEMKPSLTINLGGVGLTAQAGKRLLQSKLKLLLHDNLFESSSVEANSSWAWAEGLYRTTLIAYHDKTTPTEYTFETGRITIGRVPGNELVHPYGNISRHHAAVLVSRSGRVYAVDLKSTNGCYINGARLVEATELRVGDTFYPGGLVVKLKGEPESLMERSREGCAAYHPRAIVPWS